MSGIESNSHSASGVPSPEAWRQLEPLVDAVLDAPADRRSAVMAALSGSNAALHATLQRIIAECDQPYPPLDGVAADRFSSVFADDAVQLPEVLGDRYRLGPEVGRGGMAIVHVARDLKHAREVAVKIVRPEVAAALGRGRFLREIEIAARLRHPNIVPLYDSGEEEERSLLFYVMPYEPGHSLRERLARHGQLPVEDAVLILRDICSALSHAHQHGIVHRDIKPENILLSGRHAMVSDFGVARAISEAAEVTASGVPIAFGTAAYMSPEQAANDALVDHRADIYAVGVLGYELLTGRLPFGVDDRRRMRNGLSPNEPPALPSIRADVPEPLSETIRKCLAEHPADRWESADQLLARLDAIIFRSPGAREPQRLWRARRLVPIAGAATLLLATGIALAYRDANRPALRLGHASQLTSDPGLEVQPSLSPDGQQVAYAAGQSLRAQVFVRPLAGGKAARLTTDSSENEWLPRWAPDGKRILFLSRQGVFTAPALGGAARLEIPSRAGVIVTAATWSPDGREIAFVRGDSLLARTVATRHDRLVTTGFDLHSCDWSPDGGRLACVSGNHFYVTIGANFGLGPMFGNLAPSRIVLIPSTGGRALSITDSGSLNQSPVWARDGKTVYYVSNRDGPRDVYALAVDGGLSPGAMPVRLTTGIGAQSIDVAADGGHLIYAVYTSSANVWAMPIRGAGFSPADSALQLTSGNQTVEGVRVSLDGKWLVYDSNLSGNSDVYRIPVGGGEPERLTRGPIDKFRGALSPNGKELAYHTFQTGSRNVFLTPVSGGAAQQLTYSAGQLSMANWSPDGTALTFFDMVTSDVLVMRRDRRTRWTEPRFVGGHGWRPEWSPDGRQIAFVSPTDGHIGIVPADSGAQRDVYVPRGAEPLAELAIFSANGRELYFKSHDAQDRASFWSIPVGGGRPRLLSRFDDPARASNSFDFACDARRFYFTIEDRQSDIWVADLTRR